MGRSVAWVSCFPLSAFLFLFSSAGDTLEEKLPSDWPSASLTRVNLKATFLPMLRQKDSIVNSETHVKHTNRIQGGNYTYIKGWWSICIRSVPPYVILFLFIGLHRANHKYENGKWSSRCSWGSWVGWNVSSITSWGDGVRLLFFTGHFLQSIFILGTINKEPRMDCKKWPAKNKSLLLMRRWMHKAGSSRCSWGSWVGWNVGSKRISRPDFFRLAS